RYKQMSHRFEGRTLEEALQLAGQTLGVERFQLTYHVLLEKRGFLGGVKRIVIEADVNEEAPAPPPPPAPLETYADVPSRPRSTGAPCGGRGGGRGGNRDGGGGSREGGRGRGRGGSGDLRPGDFEAFLGELPEQTP